jgi:hypothetical protein
MRRPMAAGAYIRLGDLRLPEDDRGVFVVARRLRGLHHIGANHIYVPEGISNHATAVYPNSALPQSRGFQARTMMTT